MEILIPILVIAFIAAIILVGANKILPQAGLGGLPLTIVQWGIVLIAILLILRELGVL